MKKWCVLELRKKGETKSNRRTLHGYIVLAGLVFYDKIACCGDNSVLIYIAIHL